MADSSLSWRLDQIPPQQGRRFLITGANSGIGYAAALELARRGAVVLLACRDKSRGEDALQRLRGSATGPDSAAAEAELVVLNLASLTDIRRVVKELEAGSLPLHGLINNAGVMAPPQRKQTSDGFELQWGTNVLGHFALTVGLMPLLELGRSALPEDAPHIVTVASIAHKRGKLDFDDLNATKSYNPMGSYSQSKLGDLMFAIELERRLRMRRFGAISIAVHPGVARTNLFKVGDSSGLAGVAERAIAWTIGTLLNSDLEGALPTLFAATSKDAVGGAYYGPQGWLEMSGRTVGPAEISAAAQDRQAQSRLWSVCEEATGFHL
jgi:NAD(P)-dependent dehydrogenase (short-subunit alcohol dehydrogenase family)